MGGRGKIRLSGGRRVEAVCLLLTSATIAIGFALVFSAKARGFPELGRDLADGRVVHLGRIIVSPAQRGRGKGRELCERLVARAVQATGAGAVTLRVYRDNETALGLYLRLGFRPVGVVPEYLREI